MHRDTRSRKNGEGAGGWLELLPDPALVYPFSADGTAVFLDANPAACRRYGYSREEFRSLSPADILSPDPIPRNAWAGAHAQLATKRRHVFQTIHRDRRGREFTAEVHAVRTLVDGMDAVVAAVRDISERAKKTRELRARLRLLSLLIDAIPDIVCFKDGEGRWLKANRADCKLFGLRSTEYRGKTDRELAEIARFHRDALLTCEQTDRIAWEKKGPSRSLERIPCPDGGVNWYDIVKVPLFERDGRRKALLVFGRDITEQQRALAALRESEARFRYLFENSPVPLWEEDYSELTAYLETLFQQGVPREEIGPWLEAHPEALVQCARRVRVLNVNAAAVALHEAEHKAELLNSLERTFTEKSLPAFRAVVAALVEGRRHFRVQTEKRTLRGNRIDVIVQFALPWTVGKAMSSHYAIVATVDITPLKNAERAVNRALEELRQLHDLGLRLRAAGASANMERQIVAEIRNAAKVDGVFLYRCREGRFHWVAADAAGLPGAPEKLGEPAFEEFLCARLAPECPPLFLDDIPAQPHAPCPGCNALGLAAMAVIPLRVGEETLGGLLLAAKARRRLEPNRVFLETLAGEAALRLQNIRIIEQLRRHEAELEQRVAARTAELETANRELEAFSYSVSHDLRAPLRAIEGFAKIFAEDYGDTLDPEARRLLDVIQENARNMAQLINDLLDFSRVGRRPIHRSAVDMTALARDVFHDLASAAERRNIRFTLHPLPAVYADPVLMQRVWANLIGNALKFSRDRNPPEIEIGARVENENTVYYITDNGVGFDMRYADKLFQVFQRLHRSDEFEGTGIGLSIVERVISRHGGRVWAVGEIDRGATFFFTVPDPPA